MYFGAPARRVFPAVPDHLITMHVESVDLRSKIRKADAVLPVFARAGQRSDTLKPSRGAAQVSFVVSSRGATLLLQLSISKYKSKKGYTDDFEQSNNTAMLVPNTNTYLSSK